jgi:Holliday junction resolvase
LVNSRQKGARGEELVREILSKATGHAFDRVPGSGSGTIKGDLHILGKRNRFCIEVKNYAESPVSDKVLTNKTNDLNVWWTKLVLQAKQCGQEPLLLFKYNRSKLFVATSVKPTVLDKFLYISTLGCYIMICEEWLSKENIVWLR